MSDRLRKLTQKIFERFIPPKIEQPSETDKRIQAVLWSYRLFLDREPGEDPSIILEKARQYTQYAELRNEFLNSDEFKQKNPGSHTSALSGNEPRLQIEIAYSETDLEHLFEKTQKTWEYFGETEPFWSVLSSEKFKRANILGFRETFYSSGQGDAVKFTNTLERNGIDPSQLKSCLEYGCGMGRVTCWLAQHFEQLIGYDISLPHLELARQYADEIGIKNVTFHQTKTIHHVTNLPKVDALYSFIVLQHNPPPLIHFIIDGFLKALNPGGVAHFQVPTYRPNYQFSIQDYLNEQLYTHELEMHVLPQSEIFKLASANDCQVLEVIEDHYAGVAENALSNSFLIQKN